MSSTIDGIPSSAASSTIRRSSTVLPDPGPARIATWRRGRSASSVMASPGRRAMLEAAAYRNQARCAGLPPGMRDTRFRCRRVAVPLGTGVVVNDHLSAPVRGFLVGPVSRGLICVSSAGLAPNPAWLARRRRRKKGGGHRSADLNTDVPNRGLHVRSQTSTRRGARQNLWCLVKPRPMSEFGARPRCRPRADS